MTHTPKTPLDLLKDIPWVDAKDGFIPGTNEKAFLAVSKNGAQLPKDGYVFGTSLVGVGYYSLCTREAYQILAEKLRRKESEAVRLLNDHDMASCGCFRKPTVAEIKRRNKLVDDAKKLRSFRQFALTQFNATGPYKNLAWGNRSATESGVPFPLNCVAGDEWERMGWTLGGLCDVAGCGGYVQDVQRIVADERRRAATNGAGQRAKRGTHWAVTSDPGWAVTGGGVWTDTGGASFACSDGGGGGGCADSGGGGCGGC